MENDRNNRGGIVNNGAEAAIQKSECLGRKGMRHTEHDGKNDAGCA
ncbi:MAG: hypothetical protein K2P45_14670 [Eubacterium sp.]|nr:hypothetical protein [Eubacterium sp.]